jgi:hypothetical protein
MRWKEIRAVRRNECPDLDHDLVAISEYERARVAAPAAAVHIEADAAVEAQQPTRGQCPPPDTKELADVRPSGEMHDACRIERVQTRLARGRANPDVRRDDDHPPVREELDVHAAYRLCGGAARVHRGLRLIPLSAADRRWLERKHVLHAIAAFAVLVLAGCGGGGSSNGSPTISIQPAQQYRLVFKTIGPVVAGKPTHLQLEIIQPNGRPLTKFKRGSGPHTGVHLIMVRRDLADIVHRHPPVTPSGKLDDTVVFPAGGPYRVVVDVYPQQTTPQPNFQLFTSLHVGGAYAPQPIPPPSTTQTVDGYRFVMHGHRKLHAIQAAFLDFTVTAPDGKPATFTPWFGALAHAIFFRAGTLEYFHTHVCGPGANGCTSILGGAKVTGSSSTPGKLDVGVLFADAGTWRLFLQCQVNGHILTAPFTLNVR